MDGGRRYWAFLSYSHEDRDWANWLHRALETYALPRRLIGRPTPAGLAPRRLRPIFKDRDDLAADANLRHKVEAALAQAYALIVICSPAAAHSPWVQDEIVRFKALNGPHRVFAVIAAGAPGASHIPGREAEECFPPALRFHVDGSGTLTGERTEPVAADLRPGGDGRRLARLKLVAGVLGLDLDELVQRDAQRAARQLMAVTAASLAGLAVTGGLAIAAIASRNEARAQRAQAEGLVEFMLGDLRRQLEPTGRLDVLDAVGAKAMAYYAAQARHGMDDDALGRRARVLHMLGEIREQRGDLDGATMSFTEASAITGELLARRPGDPDRIFNHAQSAFYLGDVANRRGQGDVAESQFLEYRRLADRLVAVDPPRGLTEVSFANTDLGTLLLRSGRPQAAANAFAAALAITAERASKAPNDYERQKAAAETYAWLADAQVAQGFLPAAMAYRQSERAIYERMLARQGDEDAVQKALVVNGVAVARILSLQGRAPEAVAELSQATRRSETLMSRHPDNASYQGEAAFAFAALARLWLDRRALGPAALAADRDLALAERLTREHPSVALWRGVVLGDARLIQIRIAAARASSTAARTAALAPVVDESERLDRFRAAQPLDVGLARVAGEAALLAGDYQNLSGRKDLAAIKWREAAAAIETSGRDQAAPAGDPRRAILAQTLARLAAGRHARTQRVSIRITKAGPAHS